MRTSIAGVIFDSDGPKIDFSNYKSGTINFGGAAVVNLSGVALGGGGDGFSPILAGFDQSAYQLVTETLFERDGTGLGNELINEGSSTATDLRNSYQFLTKQTKLITNDLISPFFTGRSSEINRAQVVLKWKDDANSEDPLPKVRISKNGGLSYTDVSSIRQSGTKEGNSKELTSYGIANRDSFTALNITNQIEIAQGFQTSKTSIAYNATVSLNKSGTPYGRFKLSIREDDTAVPSLTNILCETDWFNIDDIAETGFVDYTFSFKTQAYLESGVQYHLVLSLENVDEYDFSTGVDELQWGSDTSAPTYTDGQASVGDGASFSGIAGTDHCFAVTGKPVVALPKGKISTGEAVFAKDDHYNRNSILINTSGTDDSDIELNSTTQQQLSQIFKLDTEYGLSELDILLKRTGTPGGQLVCHIYSDNSGLPGSLLYSSTNRVNADSIELTEEFITFKFDNIELNKEISYHFVIDGVGGYSPTGANHIDVRADATSPVYLSGTGIMSTYNGTIWSAIATTTASFQLKGAYQNESILTLYDKSNESSAQIDIDDGTAREKLGQLFKIEANSYLKYVSLYLNRLGNPGGNCFIELYSDMSGEPATLLATSDLVSIDDISNTSEFVNFYFQSEYKLDKNTPYWIILNVDSGYTYTDGVDEIQWFRDNTSPVHPGGGSSAYDGSVWSASSSVHIYRIHGVEAEVLLEITANNAPTVLDGFGIWYLFQDAYVTSDPNQAVINLTAEMKTSGAIPISPVIGTAGRDHIQLVINNHIFSSGVDFIEGVDTAYVSPADLVGVDKVVVNKLKQGIHFGMPDLEIRDRLRSLPDPFPQRFDNETIEFITTGGAPAMKAEFANGVIATAPSGARVSFAPAKNRYGGLSAAAEANDTEYYLYAVIQPGSTQSLGFVIDTVKPSAGGPSSYRYWKYLGRFWNDNSGNIEYPFQPIIDVTGTTTFGATYTTTVLYNTILFNKGTDILYTTDVNRGDTFTIQNDGMYQVTLLVQSDGVGRDDNVVLINYTGGITDSADSSMRQETTTLIHVGQSGSNPNESQSSITRLLKAGDIIETRFDFAMVSLNRFSIARIDKPEWI